MIDKQYEGFAASYGGRRAAGLLRAHEVRPQNIFPAVLRQAAGALPTLVPGRKYSTEMVCGPRVWASWSKSDAEKRVAGKCLSYMVKTGMVILDPHVTRSGKGKRYYVLPAPRPAVSTPPEKAPTCL